MTFDRSLAETQATCCSVPGPLLGCVRLRRLASAGFLPLVAEIVARMILGVRSMIALTKRNRPRLGSYLLAVVEMLGFPFSFVRGQDEKSMREIYAINSEWEQTMLTEAAARRNAKSALELERRKKALRRRSAGWWSAAWTWHAGSPAAAPG